MNATQRFIDLFSLSSRQAGAVAQYLQGKVTVEAKLDEPTPEGQAVTAVDYATQDLILHQLRTYWPEVGVDAEEDTPLARQFPWTGPHQPLIVLDPVDGTFNYTRGSAEYAVMAGLIMDGRFRAAVIFYPTRDELYWATEDQGCFVQRGNQAQSRVTASPLSTPLPRRLLVSAHVSDAHERRLQSLAQQVDRCRCSAFDAACVALHLAEGAVAENRTDRRRATALYLTLAAGGTVLLGGQPWQGEDPEAIDPRRFPTVCAVNAALATRLHEAWQEVG